MPTAKPRIAITLPPHTYEVIRRLAELNGQPMSRIVSELVEAVAEPLMRTVAFLEAAAAAPKEVKDGLRGTVEAMERELYGAAGYSLGQMDWLMQEMQKGGGGRGGSASAHPSPGAVPNPPTVTRGSGITDAKKIKGLAKGGKSGKKGARRG